MPVSLCGLILLGSPLQAQQIKLPVDRETAWGTPIDDIAPDPAVRYGVLPNGLHYAIFRNERPQNTVSVRLGFDVGWIDEGEDELGLAHFIEHMAFNGSTNVSEGEMVKLLEREGLAFGADTNASTGFEDTVWFRLDVGRRRNADPRWILPILCRRGGITRNEIGAIRIGPNETYFQVPRTVADSFAKTAAQTAGQDEKGGELTIERSAEGPRVQARENGRKKRHQDFHPKPSNRHDARRKRNA